MPTVVKLLLVFRKEVKVGDVKGTTERGVKGDFHLAPCRLLVF